jgi:hypothetical protein
MVTLLSHIAYPPSLAHLSGALPSPRWQGKRYVLFGCGRNLAYAVSKGYCHALGIIKSVRRKAYGYA